MSKNKFGLKQLFVGLFIIFVMAIIGVMDVLIGNTLTIIIGGLCLFAILIYAFNFTETTTDII